MAMMHMKDGLDLMSRLVAALDDIDELVKENQMLRLQAAKDRDDMNLIASKLTQTTEFYDWLMEQDASSAITYSPSRKRSEVEGKDDVALALQFIEEQA